METHGMCCFHESHTVRFISGACTRLLPFRLAYSRAFVPGYQLSHHARVDGLRKKRYVPIAKHSIDAAWVQAERLIVRATVVRGPEAAGRAANGDGVLINDTLEIANGGIGG